MSGTKPNLKSKAGLQLEGISMNDNEVFDEIAGYTNQGTGFGDVAEQLVLREANRLESRGLIKFASEAEKIDWAKQWHVFAKDVQCIESDCDYEIAQQMLNEDSSATGAYQFLTTEYGPEDREVKYNKDTGKEEVHIKYNPVHVAKNRARARGVDKTFVTNIEDNPTNWTEDQADVMFISNIAEQPGSDIYMAEVGQGVNHRATYSRFHHTKPGDKTRERMDEFFEKE